MTWTERPSEGDWDRVTAALRAGGDVLLMSHVGPDGDTLGSALAVGLALGELGLAARVSFDEVPFGVPHSLAWLPGRELLIAADDAPFAPDLAVAFDASSSDRLGRLAAVGERAGLFAAIDHHRSYTGFAGISIVDPAAPATAVLALELIDRLGVPLTADIATCLYTGLSTDTGSFKFADTTAATHRVAARLHEAGIRHDQIARAVFDTQPFAALMLLGAAVSGATLDESAAGGLGLISTSITAAARAGTGLRLDAAEPVIDTLRRAEEAEIAAVLKQEDGGSWQVSVRSKGAIDVGAVCTALGGGGHRFAAGFSAAGNPDQILARLRTAADQVLAGPGGAGPGSAAGAPAATDSGD